MLRTTNQRKVILEELRGVKIHPSASTLYRIVKLRLPRISLATVYRNLELLIRLGLARKLALSQGETRYDAVMMPHHHIRCLKCGRIDDVDQPLPRQLNLPPPEEAAGYQVEGCNIEFMGICPACRFASSSGETDDTESSQSREE